mgnify:CR=1 FL=1
MKRMRYSPDVDILLMQLSSDPVDHAEESGPFIVHFAKSGKPVLLEIQDAKQFVLESLHALFEEAEATVP